MPRRGDQFSENLFKPEPPPGMGELPPIYAVDDIRPDDDSLKKHENESHDKTDDERVTFEAERERLFNILRKSKINDGVPDFALQRQAYLEAVQSRAKKRKEEKSGRKVHDPRQKEN